MDRLNINATTTTTTTIAYLEHEQHIGATVQIICYSFVFVISMFTNLLIFLVIGCDKKLHTKTNFLLLSLALTDLLVVLFGIPVNIINLRAGKSKTPNNLCKITGFMILIPFMASNYTLALIALHRYILIVKNHLYKSIFSRKNIISAVIVLWSLTFLLGIPPIFGWGNYAYNADRAHCMINWGYSKSYLVFLQVAAFPLPFNIMCFCYYKVISHTRASTKRLRASADRHNLIKKLRELRVTLMLVLVLVVFFTLYIPYAVLIYWEGFSDDVKVPQIYSFLALLFAYSNSMFDFWIYAGVSMKFRKSVFRLFTRLTKKHTRTRVHPATDHTMSSEESDSDSDPRMSSTQKETVPNNGNSDTSPVIIGNRSRGLSIASFFQKEHRSSNENTEKKYLEIP